MTASITPRKPPPIEALHLRRYEPDDHDEVRRLHELGLDQTGSNAGVGPWDDDLLDITDTYLESGGEFLVAFVGRRLVAMGALRRTSAERAEIKRMRVLPGYQRRGLGRWILGELETRAHDLGYHTLHLDTTSKQLAAISLYEGSGYVRVGRDTLGDLELVLYEKDLAPQEP